MSDILKCAWRMRAHVKPLPATAEELVALTRNIAQVSGLSRSQHLRAAHMALKKDTTTLAFDLVERERKEP